MALAETAELAVLLKLNDQLSGPMKGVNARIKELEATSGGSGRAIGALESGFGKVSTAAGKFGGAMGHAKSQLGGLISGPLGLIGLGAGLFTVGGALEKGITRAQDFGTEVYKLQAITALSAETTSAMAAGLEHFGIGADAALRSIGFLEKNVGLLAAKKDGIVKFESEFGLALTDTNGKIKDANQLLLTTADYFNNKSIPATEKAAALAKLYGRSWQTLLPALIAGRKGIEDAEVAAKDLGLTLTQDNLGALAKFRGATRELGTAVGGLELQIGLALVPALTDLATVATHFVANNREKIVGFFKDAAKFARDLGGVVEHQVIPVFKAIAGAWAGVPKEVRDLVVAGFVGNKVIKWTFGFSPISFATDAFKGILGQFFQRGSPGNPLFVVQEGGGGGLPGALPAAAGGLAGLAGTAAPVVIPVAIAGGALVSLNVIAQDAGQNLIMSRKGLTNAEIIAQRYYTANAADQATIAKRLMNHIPSVADFNSGNAKLAAATAAAAATVNGAANANGREDRGTARATAAAISQHLNAVRAATLTGAGHVEGAIRRKRMSVTTKVMVNPMTVVNVSSRDFARSVSTYSKYYATTRSEIGG